MKYAIIHVNNRCIENIYYNKNILKNWQYINDIEYFDGTKGKAWDVLNHNKIKLDVWSPYDGRQSPPLPGEYGIWLSTINVWKYITENKIKSMLVLEDDIILYDDFIEKIKICLDELPSDFDFLSLYYFENQNHIDENTEFGAKNIHKSLNQYSAGQATIYSYSGAKKLLNLVKRLGIEYTTDCFIFNKSQSGLLNGYSIKPDNMIFLKHDNKKIKSLIDPENLRNA